MPHPRQPDAPPHHLLLFLLWPVACGLHARGVRPCAEHRQPTSFLSLMMASKSWSEHGNLYCYSNGFGSHLSVITVTELQKPWLTGIFSSVLLIAQCFFLSLFLKSFFKGWINKREFTECWTYASSCPVSWWLCWARHHWDRGPKLACRACRPSAGGPPHCYRR